MIILLGEVYPKTGSQIIPKSSVKIVELQGSQDESLHIPPGLRHALSWTSVDKIRQVNPVDNWCTVNIIDKSSVSILIYIVFRYLFQCVWSSPCPSQLSALQYGLVGLSGFFELDKQMRGQILRNKSSSKNDIIFNLQPNNMWLNRGILVLLLLVLTLCLVSQQVGKLFPAPFQHNFPSCSPNSFPKFFLL